MKKDSTLKFKWKFSIEIWPDGLTKLVKYLKMLKRRCHEHTSESKRSVETKQGGQ